jgi:O-antigen biosynthesis protein
MAKYELLQYLRQRPFALLTSKIWCLWRETGFTGMRWRFRLLRSQTRGYRQWLEIQETREASERDTLAAELAAVRTPPLISIVMPVCDVSERWLRCAIDSVRDQLYPHWQLCIVDDASTLPHVRPLLEAATAADPRIRLVLRESRGHICLATRAALSLAEGEFVSFLDHDDELAPLALAHVAVEIARNPEADLLYTDEDLIGTDGRRYDPYFKPDWNPELLRAQNYLCHLSVYRAELLRELDAFRPEVQGSQDWDLALRASERARCIRHLPYVLYHWRTVPGSTARADTAKHYSLEAGRHAVQDHLARCCEQAEVDLLPFGHLHVRHALPEPMPRISLIITEPPNGSVADSLIALLQNATYPDIELLVATSRTCHEGTLPSGTRIISAEHDGVVELLNRAVSVASGDILCFVNGACQAQDADWLPALAAEAARTGIGAVGARLLLADGSVWHAGYLLDPCAVVLHPYRGAPAGFPGLRNRAILQQEMSCVSADCFAIKRTVFIEVGGFDTASGPYYDVDFCLRLMDAGFRNVWTPRVSLVLHERPEREADTGALRLMQSRWGERLAHDPAGNFNLVLAYGLPTPRTTLP